MTPWAWIPTLYMAEGAPYFAVNTLAMLFLSEMGLSNADVALYTSWMYLPWVIKPLWSPFVDVDIKFLSGAGVPAYKGNKKLEGCVAWKIVTDLTDDMPDVLPVLVSRNLQTDTFPMNSTKDTLRETTQIKTDSNFPQPFGNKASVVIHKGGAANVVKAKYSKKYLVFNKQSFTVPQGLTCKLLEP